MCPSISQGTSLSHEFPFHKWMPRSPILNKCVPHHRSLTVSQFGTDNKEGKIFFHEYEAGLIPSSRWPEEETEASQAQAAVRVWNECPRV